MENTELDLGTNSDRNFTTRNRAKTSLRMRYEAEIEVLKKDMGTLEDLRIRLGLSRRKICQILMVDPSAWTRWTSGDGDAPPHIYKALRWYLDSKSAQSQRFDVYWEELKAENRNLHGQLSGLQTQVRKLRFLTSTTVILALASLLCGAIYWLILPHL